MTEEQYEEWKKQNCGKKLCEECIFYFINCLARSENSWINNKDLCSDKFLEQEVEIKREILTEKEKAYLSSVIKPFRDKVVWIKKIDYLFVGNQFITIKLKDELNDEDFFSLPLFKENKYYKGMEVGKEYTLEELGL